MTARMKGQAAQFDAVDPIWSAIRREAQETVDRDPILAAFIYGTILNEGTLEEAVSHRISSRLDHPDIPAHLLRQTYDEMLAETPGIAQMIRADIQAVYDRDPACTRFMEPVLYFKGFHALQTHRLAHWLWNTGRRDFALYIQSRSSAVCQPAINPASPAPIIRRSP